MPTYANVYSHNMAGGGQRHTTDAGHVIQSHPASRNESAYVSVIDTDGRFIRNYPMTTTAEANEESFAIAYAYAAGHPYH